MRTCIRSLGPIAGLTAVLLLAAPLAHASNVLTKVTSFGTVGLPFTTGYSSTLTPAQVTPTDLFYEDYRFTVADGTFSSVSATFDLGQIFSIANLSARLLVDPDPTSMPTTPWALTASSVLQRWSNAVASGMGTGSVQAINPYSLAAGSYIFEVRGNVTGAAGGSYGGVFNIAAVPEVDGMLMAIAGIALLGLFGRGRRRVR